MKEEKQSKASITKSHKKIGLSGNVIEESYLSIEGMNLKEVKKVFKELYKK